MWKGIHWETPRIRAEKMTTLKKQQWRWNTDREKFLFGNNEKRKPGKKLSCVYFTSNEHSSHNCTKVLDIAARRLIIQRNGLCYNCTGSGHGASQCRSRECRNCDSKHHTSICDRMKSTTGLFQDSSVEKSVSVLIGHTSTLHPTVQAKVGPKTVRVMFDSGVRSSYLCTDVITKLNLKPTRKEQRCIEQMIGTTRRNVEVYNITIQSLAVEGFSFEVECINAEKDMQTYLPNPNVTALKKHYGHLRRLNFGEEETTRVNASPHHSRRCGLSEDTHYRATDVGGKSRQGPRCWIYYAGLDYLWTSPYDRDWCREAVFFFQSGQEEFQKLCSLDVLGIADRETREDSRIHEDFLQQLRKTPDGYYETKLPWKADHVALPSNKSFSAARLNSRIMKLERAGKPQEYHQIMQDQVSTRITEQVPVQPKGRLYITFPTKRLFENKLRQRKWESSMTVRQEPISRAFLSTTAWRQDHHYNHSYLTSCYKIGCGSIKKAFFQIRVHEQNRDTQRVFWFDNLSERKVKEYRFTRVICGATSSPYILGVKLQKHVQLHKGVCFNSIITFGRHLCQWHSGGGATEEDMAKFKEESTEILSEDGQVAQKCEEFKFRATSLQRRDVCKEPGVKQHYQNPWNTMGQTVWHPVHRLQNVIKNGQAFNQTEDDLCHQQFVWCSWLECPCHDDS